ncbi:MAG: DNA translocase FtsK, partial [Planctomycetota bacterium]
MVKDDKRNEPADELPRPHHEGPGRFVGYCLSLVLTGVVALAWLSLLTYNTTDWPSPTIRPAVAAHNAAGTYGAWLAYTLFYWCGAGAFMVLLATSGIAFALLCGGRIRHMAWRIGGVMLLAAATSAGVQLRYPSIFDPGQIPANGPGVLGYALGMLLTGRMGPAGSWLVVLVAFAIGLMFAADDLILRLPHFGRKAWQQREALPAAIRALTDRLPRAQSAPAELTSRPRVTAAAPGAGGKVPPPRVEATADADVSRRAPMPKIRRPAPEESSDTPAPTQGVPKAEKTGKPGAYEKPSSDLLSDPTGGYLQSQETVAARKREVLQQTVDDFGVQAQVVGYMTGPVITLFELSLAAGVKVSQVSSLSKDIARALAVPAVRIVSPLPGKDTIGIEVPNLEKEIVRIKELMALDPAAETKMHLPLYLGKDASGGAIVTDLATMPHMLIAGTTGSGKSVCINAIIMSLLMTRTPEQVGFILADPKMVEMAAYEHIPHLLCPIVTDMRRAEDILEWAATKMDERYEVLKEAGVRNIAEYNRLDAKKIYELFGAETDEDRARIPTRMPHYVIIIDELADLMMTSGKDVEAHIIRIAQKARAIGIHLVLATQRPSVNVVTGLIKSNMPCRVS